jgi:H+-translocating NAD(P) transhydrogenase subunit alpha
MVIAVLKEHHPGERRVALPPAQARALGQKGIQVRVEAGAGAAAGWHDDAYLEAGVGVHSDLTELLSGVQGVLKVRPFMVGTDGARNEVALLPRDAVALSLMSPGADPGLLDALSERGVTAMALERIPRSTRAQRMDVLSSQATVAGYRAVLLAAELLPRFFPMLTTAAGTVPPARVLVLGAGVAGLQAIASARRLGGSVTGYDIPPAAREQIRSLGARALEEEQAANAEGEGGYARALAAQEAERQLALLGHHVPLQDVVITTAQIPGRKAPLLVTEEMVRGMRPGSVIVDLAGETGGNCELTQPGRVVIQGGVQIVAPLDLPSRGAEHASTMFGRNLQALLEHLAPNGSFVLDFEEEITAAITLIRAGAHRVEDSKEGE